MSVDGPDRMLVYAYSAVWFLTKWNTELFDTNIILHTNYTSIKKITDDGRMTTNVYFISFLISIL